MQQQFSKNHFVKWRILVHFYCFSILFFFAVAEWSEVLASFFCACSHKNPRFEPNHGAHRQATLVVDSNLGCSTLIRSVWADSARFMSSCRKWVATLLWWRRWYSSATVTMPAYRKVAGVKTCHSPTTFGGYTTTFTFFLCAYVCFVVKDLVTVGHLKWFLTDPESDLIDLYASRNIRIKKLHRVIEMVIMLEHYLNLPRQHLCTVARWLEYVLPVLRSGYGVVLRVC